MKKRVFLVNAVLLTAASLLSRTIGIAFRVYMSNQIGAQGIGLYQLIFTVYMFVATFATAGISLAVTRLVTDALALQQYGKARSILHKCFILSLILSTLSATALFFGAEFMGSHFINDSRTILPLKILAPSLPFMAVSSCFRGYFYAVRKVVKTASEQLFEQFVEIIVFAILIGRLAPLGLSYACCAVVIGTTAAEILSCGYSYILYRFEVRHSDVAHVKQPGVLKKILGICLPVMGSSCLRSGLSTLENVLIPVGLKKNGASYEASLAGYGMLTGMVMPVIGFPSAFLTSFSMLLIPELSEANAVHHERNIRYIATRVFQITLLFSILITGIFIFFANDLGLLIYGDTQPGLYIRILAPVIPLMYLDSVVDGMLKGLNEQLRYMSYNLIDSTVRVILIFFLLPICGIKGVIIVIFVSEILNSTLSIARLIKVTTLHFQTANWILKPALSIAVPGLTLVLLAPAMALLFPSLLLRMVLEIAVTVTLYIVLLFCTRCLTKEDVLWAKNIFVSKSRKKSSIIVK